MKIKSLVALSILAVSTIASAESKIAIVSDTKSLPNGHLISFVGSNTLKLVNTSCVQTVNIRECMFTMKGTGDNNSIVFGNSQAQCTIQFGAVVGPNDMKMWCNSGALSIATGWYVGWDQYTAVITPSNI